MIEQIEHLAGDIASTPRQWAIDDRMLLRLRNSIRSGLDYARECRSKASEVPLPVSLRDKIWIERLDADIRSIEALLGEHPFTFLDS